MNVDCTFKNPSWHELTFQDLFFSLPALFAGVLHEFLLLMPGVNVPLPPTPTLQAHMRRGGNINCGTN